MRPSARADHITRARHAVCVCARVHERALSACAACVGGTGPMPWENACTSNSLSDERQCKRMSTTSSSCTTPAADVDDPVCPCHFCHWISEGSLAASCVGTIDSACLHVPARARARQHVTSVHASLRAFAGGVELSLKSVDERQAH